MTDIDKPEMITPNFTKDNIAKLAVLFPNCVTEGESGCVVDFDLLRQELNENAVEGIKERYRLEWPGKREAISVANMPTTNTLRPVKKDSVNWENTENIYLEGDNLEVLKLLQRSYLGKVKIIYIDPPYNTGNDFVYKDDFAQDSEEYKQESGQKDEWGNRLVKNPESNGRYHSDWLSMMYPRLKLARNLLTDDGVIFISIDDNEAHNLRKICDEIFGESNLIEQLIWKCRAGGGSDSKFFSNDHEYVLCYSKDVDLLDRFYTDYTEEQLKKFQYVDEKGQYFIKTLEMPEALGKRPNLQYPIVAPDGSFIQKKREGTDYTWVLSEPEFFKYKENGLIEFKKTNDKWMVYRKYHIDKEGGQTRKTKPRSILEKIALTANGGKELKSLFSSDTENKIFDNPKPINLIKYILKIVSDNNDTVLDFFSGSATTAHAVMQLNAEDGGNRKFIMVQLLEQTDEKSEANKSGYTNICEIGKERIRRAGNKIQEELNNKKQDSGLFKEEKKSLDTGFRVYRLDSTNMNDVYYRPQDFNRNLLDQLFTNIKSDRSNDDLLAGIMVDWGLPLSSPMKELTILGKRVFSVSGNSLYACFEKDIDEAFAKEVAKDKPLRIIFRDDSFVSDTAKENVYQLLKQLSPDTEMKVI
jgi:adenine-specific DNA-methyltransferase